MKRLYWTMLISVLVHAGLFFCMTGQSAQPAKEEPLALGLSLSFGGRGEAGERFAATRNQLNTKVNQKEQSNRSAPKSAPVQPVKVLPVPGEDAAKRPLDQEAKGVSPVDSVAEQSSIKMGESQSEQADGMERVPKDRETGDFVGDSPPMLIQDLTPVYPEEARFYGWEGRVVLDFNVQEDGRVQEVRIFKSSGRACLDRAAVTAARSWRYRPALRAGQIATEQVRRIVRFRLE